MKKSIFTSLLIICAIQLTTAQKIYLTYQLKTADATYSVTDKAFSDEAIQTQSDSLFSKIITNKNVISIEDNLNRRYDKIKFYDTEYYSKVLNQGFYNLYELQIENKPVYIVYSKTDTIILEKNDSLVDHLIMKDRGYHNKLVYLAKDYQDLWDAAGKVNFGKKDLQKFVSVLNEKQGGTNIKMPLRHRTRYLNFSIKGMTLPGTNEISLSALVCKYYLEMSPNLSFRYGIVASYSERNLDDGYDYAIPTLDVPLMVNYEITNAKLTAHFNAGLSQIFYYDSDFNDLSTFLLIPFVSAGAKLKLTKNFNILAEAKYNVFNTMYSATHLVQKRGININVGIEYSLKL